jgi:DNA-directed RNA polymerase II subunit RPB2
MSLTPIPLNCGLSIKIGDMGDKGWNVLGWDEKNKNIVPGIQTEFLCKGERECVELTFNDGRKKICTPNHLLLTEEGNWEKAELTLNKKLKTCVVYPVMDFNKDIEICNNWSMKIGEINLETNSIPNFLKSLAFMRIMGLLCSDGGFYKHNNHIFSRVSLGHITDMNIFDEDLNLFTYKNSEWIKDSSQGCYELRLPRDFTTNVLTLEGITIGKKINQPIKFPNFILDDNLPLPLLREFLGALFGGDGHTCYLTKHRGKRDLLTSISFSRSSLGSNLQHLKTYMNQLQGLLNKLGIEKITIQNPKETTFSKNSKREKDENKCYQINLHLDINELIPFHDKIGFRYCCHKSLRLEAGVSYRRLRETVVDQHNWIVNRVDELTDFANKKKENPDKIIPTKKAIEQATKELQKKEMILHKYAIPTTHDITDHLVKGTKFGSFRSKSFPTVEDFVTEIGALEWFDDGYATKTNEGGLPTMNLEVIDIRPVGKHLVYDIEVDKIHSFLANGIVAHNCMIGHGMGQFLKETLVDKSDKTYVYVCSNCGLFASKKPDKDIYTCQMCSSRDESYSTHKVEMSYAFKLLVQELKSINILPRIKVETDIYNEQPSSFKI